MTGYPLRARTVLPAAALLAATAALAATGNESAQKVDPAAARMKALPPAALDDTLAIGGTEIDAKTLASRMTVPVKVNGAGPYRFIVDSGADSSVVGERIARDLKLPLGRRTILNSITDSQYVDRVLVDELELGPTRVRDLELPVLRERDLGAHGMLGLDALVEQRLMLDFEKRLITVDDARTPLPRFDGEIVVTARLRRGQLILTEVRAGTQQVDAVVDTGSEVTIGNLALRDKLIRRDPKQFSEIEVIGVTGTASKLQVARLPLLRIGGVTMQNVTVAFADVPPFDVFGIKGKPSLLLGTDLMSNFRRVSLDFRDRKVRFQLKRCTGNNFAPLSQQNYITRLGTTNPADCSR
jgi:predicted aspartyl protease